jgi:hypothetical protein
MKKQEEQKMYQHSLGHYHTQSEAMMAKKVFQKEYNVTLSVVKEERSNNTHKKWCVCEYYPEKNNKTNRKKGKKKA